MLLLPPSHQPDLSEWNRTLILGGFVGCVTLASAPLPFQTLPSVLPPPPEGSKKKVPGEGAGGVHRGPAPQFARNVVAAPLTLSQEKLKPQYLEQLPGHLKQFSLFLGKFSWFAGEKVGRKEGEGIPASPCRRSCAPGLTAPPPTPP